VRYVALALYNLMTRDHRVTNVVVREAIQALQRRNEASSREVALLLDCVRALLLRSWSDDSTLPAATPPGNGVRDEYAPEMDSFFAALGDQFRGSSELTRDRLRIYLPRIRAAAVRGPALDLGCGRGEWLELLREEKIDALGVEQNRTLTAACRAKNLRIVEADFMAFLEQSPPDHWGLVTGFHVIEHLRWPAWYDCVRQIHRALVTGGMAILETPNPRNLVTAASRFYLDPTHTHPIPDALLAFVAKSVGFSIVEILPLHPVFDSESVDVVSSMLPLLSGPQDYAIIVRK
jgi:O-antigen chain-terminating methyltransferase